MTEAATPTNNARSPEVQSFSGWFNKAVAVQLIRPMAAIDALRDPATQGYKKINEGGVPTVNQERARPLMVLLGTLKPSHCGTKLVVTMSIEPGVVSEVLIRPELIDYVTFIAIVPASVPEPPRVVLPGNAR